MMKSFFRSGFLLVSIALSLIVPIASHAETVGLAPPVVTIESLPNQTQNGVFFFVRGNPSQDKTVSISYEGDLKSNISSKQGLTLDLPVGEEKVAYHFSVDTTKLEVGKTYQGIINLILNDSSAFANGQRIRTGVSGRVVVKVVDKLSPKVTVKEYPLAPLSIAVKKPNWFAGLFPFRSFQSAKVSDISNLDGYFFRNTSDGKNSLIRLTDGAAQSLDGLWNFFMPAREQLFAFPLDNSAKTGYKQEFFLMEHQGISSADASVLPNKIDSVVENEAQTYALFIGKHATGSGNFVCLTELNIPDGPKCVYLDSVSTSIAGSGLPSVASAKEGDPTHNEVSMVNFLDGHTVAFSTPNGTFVYDAWLKTVKQNDSQKIPPVAKMSSAQNLFSLPIVKTFLGFSFAHGDFVFLGFGTEVRRLNTSTYLLTKRSRNSIDVSIANLSTMKKASLATLGSSDQLFWLRNGTLMTNP